MASYRFVSVQIHLPPNPKSIGVYSSRHRRIIRVSFSSSNSSVAAIVSSEWSDLVRFKEMAGQSDPDLALFSPEEIEFMAEDEMIEIVPNMRMDALNLVSGDFGPFMPQIAAKVPLWLAVAMRKRGKCTILCPEWMSVVQLTEVLEAERESPNAFQPVPFHYIEISRLLFDHAREDIPDTYLVRSLVEDIKNVRFHKIEINLKGIQGRVHAVKIKNLSAMEVNIVRRFLVTSLQAFYKHDSPEMIDQIEPSTIQRPQATNNIARRVVRR